MKRVTLRVEQPLYDRARRLAERDRRSLHAEVLRLIEIGLRTEEKRLNRPAPPSPYPLP